jgi:myb proto-oncogene protein
MLLLLPTADHANEDPLKGTWSMGPWTPGEDAKLISAVTNTSKKSCGQQYILDWAEIAALVPGRTEKQCRDRWKYASKPDGDRATELKSSRWTAVEDSKLKDAVQTHGGNNWAVFAVLVPGRTKQQCRNRWRDVLDCSIDRANRRSGTWTTGEDSKLKDAVQMHGDKNWAAIAALIPGRTQKHCCQRWHSVLDLKGVCWTAGEDSQLKDAVQTHGGNNWAVIAALIPCRTPKQCHHRWHDVLDCSIDRANRRSGTWTAGEDNCC